MFNFKLFKLTRFPIAAGISPVNWLLVNSNTVKFDYTNQQGSIQVSVDSLTKILEKF